MAELVSRHPDRFLAAAACIPMNDVDAAIGELDRAVGQLGFRGVQIYTDCRGVPLDDPRFAPIFDRVAALDIPVLLHPVRGPDRPDYPTEDASRFDTWRAIGWLYDTVSAMARLTFSGLFDRHPGHQDRHASPGRLCALRGGTPARGLRQAAQGRARPERTGSAEEASVRVFPRVLCRHDHDRIGAGAAVRPRLLRRRSRDVRDRHAVRHRWAACTTSRSRSRRWRRSTPPPADKAKIFELNARRVFGSGRIEALAWPCPQ